MHVKDMIICTTPPVGSLKVRIRTLPSTQTLSSGGLPRHRVHSAELQPPDTIVTLGWPHQKDNECRVPQTGIHEIPSNGDTASRIFPREKTDTTNTDDCRRNFNRRHLHSVCKCCTGRGARKLTSHTLPPHSHHLGGPNLDCFPRFSPPIFPLSSFSHAYVMHVVTRPTRADYPAGIPTLQLLRTGIRHGVNAFLSANLSIYLCMTMTGCVYAHG